MKTTQSRALHGISRAVAAAFVPLLCSQVLLAQSTATANLVPQQPRGPQARILILPEGVFNAVDGTTHKGWGVLVVGDRINAVGPASSLNASAPDTIRLDGMTLMPGMIEAHTHMFLHPYNETPWNDQVLHESLAERTLRA